MAARTFFAREKKGLVDLVDIENEINQDFTTNILQNCLVT